MSFYKLGQSQQGGDFTKLTGSANEGRVSNCDYCKIQANDSKLQVSNCDYAELKVTASSIQMSNCDYAKLQGKNFSIRATNCDYTSMSSVENGQFHCQNSDYLTWNGTGGLGEINRDDYTLVNGGHNQLKSQNNSYLSIIGNSNKVAAVKSQYLRIKGNNNEVLSSNTHYVTVEGDHNNVMVENTPDNGTCHFLSRVSDEGENELCLQKSPPKDIETSGFSWKGINVNSICNDTITTTRININGVNVYSNVVVGRGSNAKGSSDAGIDVKLNYKDEVSIVGNTYTSGIFKFQLNKLDKDKAQVVVSKEGMDRYELEPLEWIDSIVISGKKDGKVETLNIIGQKVEDISETEFEVLFYESES